MIAYELAANLGTKIKVLCKEKVKNIPNILSTFDELDTIVKHTQIYLPKNLYAVDVLVWTSAEFAQLDIDQLEKDRIYSNMLFTFDLVEFSDLGIVSSDALYELRFKGSELFRDEKRADEAFDKLIEIGSADGIYLRTRRMIDLIDFNRPLSKNEINECQKAIKYLASYEGIIKTDVKCLYQILKLIWVVYSKQPMFYKEKITLPFKRGVWQTILETTELIEDLSTDSSNAYLLYLQAVAYFHLDKVPESLEVFKRIRDNFYVGPRRIILSYLASETNGEMKKYSGELRSLHDNKAMIYVNELRKELPYFDKNFISQNPTLKSRYTGFGIGFNFLGPQITNLFGEGVRK